MVEFFSFFRKRRRGPPRAALAVHDETMDLANLGGTINGTYLDIASVPVSPERPRGGSRGHSAPEAAPSASG